MAGPRKVFRIEETAAARQRPNLESARGALPDAEIVRELRALRAALVAPAPASPGNGGVHRQASRLGLIAGAIHGGDTNDAAAAAAGAGASAANEAMPRIARELNAVVESSERATQKILTAAEDIDVAAGNLSAALGGSIEQGLAQDIQDLVIQIFEACNFQDLIGQRIAKVLATLDVVEDHIARVLDEIKNASAGARRCGANSLHGPRLDSDSGHASQDEVDAMFGKRRMASGE